MPTPDEAVQLFRMIQGATSGRNPPPAGPPAAPPGPLGAAAGPMSTRPWQEVIQRAQQASAGPTASPVRFSPARPMLSETSFAGPEGVPFGPLPVQPSRMNQPQRRMAAENPGLALAEVLASRGIDQNSALGRHFMSQSDALPRVYEMLAAGSPGEVTYDASQFPEFLQGLVDSQVGAEPRLGGERSNQRGDLRAQVELALTAPDTEVYKSVAAMQEVGVQGDRGLVRGPWALWEGMIYPAMVAMGSTPMGIQIARTRFSEAVANHNKAQFQGDQRPFQQWLRETGYVIPV